VDLANARRLLGLSPHYEEIETQVAYAVPTLPIRWVRTPEELRALVDALKSEPFVALDVETTLADQELCLVQLGTAEASYLVDPASVGSLDSLGEVLADPAIEKVIHNAQFEQTVLGKLGYAITNIRDTLVLSRRKYGPLAAGHSLLAVVRRELDLVLDKRCQTSDWRRRPLSAAQERYAALDVEVLVRLRALL
jgi:ribonuclease D